MALSNFIRVDLCSLAVFQYLHKTDSLLRSV
jgi:hypothetical protein